MDGCDGTENLLRPGESLRRDLGKHGWPVEELFIGAARGQVCPRIHAGGYQSVYVLALVAVDDGAERDLLGRRVADG